MMQDATRASVLRPDQLQVLVCCHKSCELPSSDYLLPIQVGAALTDGGLGMQRDDEVAGHPCPNISAQNPNYCELTALYWAWKNVRELFPNLEYLGLNHYRRYFAFDHAHSVHDLMRRPEAEVTSYSFDAAWVSRALARKGAIIAKRKLCPYPLAIGYGRSHVSEDLRVLQEVLHELCPEYDQTFLQVMMGNNALHPYNMFVMGCDALDRYCSWVFPILAEMEARVDISGYNAKQGRIYGYLAERLFNIWLCENGVPYVQVGVYEYETSPLVEGAIKCVAKNVRSMVGFACSRPLHNLDQYFE